MYPYLQRALRGLLASYVPVNKFANMKLLDERKKGEFRLSSWREHHLNPSELSEDTVSWYFDHQLQLTIRIFLCDTLNFSFWAETPDDLPQVEYEGKNYTGYWSLCAALNRALKVKHK